jgi:hypothetical protein
MYHILEKYVLVLSSEGTLILRIDIYSFVAFTDIAAFSMEVIFFCLDFSITTSDFIVAFVALFSLVSGPLDTFIGDFGDYGGGFGWV